MTVYLNKAEPTPPDHGRSDPVGVRRNVREIKKIPIEEVAGTYGEFRAMGGGRRLGRCLSPDHEDKNPSMNVYPDRQKFWCYGCGENGDVIDLVMLAEGCEFHEALLILAQRHGVELPGRPEDWHRKQERQKPVRDEMRRLGVRILRRRLYAILEPMVLAVEDDALRKDIAREVWDALGRQAEDLYARRIGTGR